MKTSECDDENSIVFVDLKTYRHYKKIGNYVKRIRLIPPDAQFSGRRHGRIQSNGMQHQILHFLIFKKDPSQFCIKPCKLAKTQGETKYS